MSDEVDGRRVRRWWASSRERPQYLIHITALPSPTGWTVRLHRLAGVCERYEVECVTGWEAAEEVREIMDALDVNEPWTMSID